MSLCCLSNATLNLYYATFNLYYATCYPERTAE